MSGLVPQSVDNALKIVETHYQIAAALIVVLVLLLILCYFKKEHFNPTATMYKIGQDQQGVGWTASENRERAEGGKPAAPAAAGPKEGTAAWAVLHSDDFACDKREPVGDDAWGWMVGHSKDAESAHGGRGRLSEGALTKSMAGQH